MLNNEKGKIGWILLWVLGKFLFYFVQAALAHLKKQGDVTINSAQIHMYIAFLIATVTLLIPTLLPMLRHEA